MAEAVQIHRIRVPDGLAWSAALSEAERVEAARFRFAADRDRFVAGRAASRRLLGQALGMEPAALEFGEGARGKPFVRGAARPIHFNRAHSGDWVVIAISEQGEVGIDVELARPEIDIIDLGRSVLTAAELAALTALPEGERRAAFFQVWSRKEAALKAWGVGLYLEPRELEVGIDPARQRHVGWPAGVPAAGLSEATGGRPAALTIEDIVIDASHAGAVAWLIE